MAEQQKPKIDLKSRLQRMGPGAASTPPPPGTGSVPAPPPMGRSVPPLTPGAPTASVPPQFAGVAKGGAAQDPRNPLAAAAHPGFRPAGGVAATSTPQVQSQRIA